MKLLIVDDTPEDRETVKRYLTREGSLTCALIEAETGGEGLELFRREQPDTVLLDFHLPDMDGLDFLRALADETGTDALPVIMLTGTGSEEVAVDALKSGAQDYLIKGRVTPTAVQRAVLRAVEKLDMLKRLQAQHDELELKNRELEEAHRRKDEFLAMLAHELRNPLAAIRNAVEVLKVAGSDRERFTKATAILDRQIRHQGHLLDELLDVSRITRGKMLLTCERLDLGRVVRDTVTDHRPALEQGELTLAAEVPEEPVWVHGDAVRLSQVLGNLLSNALKFTDSGGQVTVTLTTTETDAPVTSLPGTPGQSPTPCEPAAPAAGGGWAVVNVRDSGMGISPEMLPHVFDTFAQADRTLDRSRGGLGLGLALVKGLVELHGGNVRAGSEGPGRGAEFSFTLPLTSAAESREFGGSPRRGSRRIFRILMIEDNRDAAQALRDYLELSGHEVELAYTGPAGLQAAHRFQPEVILCDLGLPGLDGFEVARALREDPELRRVRLIAISGYGQEEDRRRAREAGFDFHLTKPVDPSDLLQFLHKL